MRSTFLVKEIVLAEQVADGVIDQLAFVSRAHLQPLRQSFVLRLEAHAEHHRKHLFVFGELRAELVDGVRLREK